MSKKKEFIICLILLLLLPSLSGCWDRRELEERVSVVAISVDLNKDEEEDAPKYVISIQIPIPIRIAGGTEGGGGEGGADAVKVMTSVGQTLGEAIANLQKRLNQQIFLGHTRVIAISEAVAREGVEDILDGLRRDPALRRLLWFLVVEGEATELLQSDPKLEQIPMVYIMSLIENGARTGMLPDVTLGSFYISESAPYIEPIINVVKASQEDVTWDGVGLFHGERMVGKLDTAESWYILHLRRENPGGIKLVYPDEDDPEKYITIRPKEQKTDLNVQFKEGQVHVHFHIQIEANIIEKDEKIKLESAEDAQKLARMTSKALEKEAKKVVDKLQEEYKVDVIRLGRYIKAYHHRQWEKMNWEEEFANTNITVTYDVEFRRTGMQLK